MNLLNELRRRDKMRGLLSILSLFRNEFDKFKNIQEHELYIIQATFLTREVNF